MGKQVIRDEGEEAETEGLSPRASARGVYKLCNRGHRSDSWGSNRCAQFWGWLDVAGGVVLLRAVPADVTGFAAPVADLASRLERAAVRGGAFA